MRLALVVAGATLCAPALGAERPVVAVYRGTLPCADCAGVETELTIRARSATEMDTASFWLVEKHRGAHAGDHSFESGGSLIVRRGSASDPDATVYELQEARSRQSRFFLRVGDAELRPLDARKAESGGPSLKRVGPR